MTTKLMFCRKCGVILDNQVEPREPKCYNCNHPTDNAIVGEFSDNDVNDLLHAGEDDLL